LLTLFILLLYREKAFASASISNSLVIHCIVELR
jgi:hypothetical protein